MKQIALIVLVAAVAASGFEIRQPRDLQDDLNDFYELLPIDEITNLALDYFINDEEVQSAFFYLRGEEFKVIWVQLVNNKDIRNIVRYLQDSGLDVVTSLNDFANIFGLQQFPAFTEFLGKFNFHFIYFFSIYFYSICSATKKIAGGINGLLQDIIALLPLDKIKNLYQEKMKTSTEFKELINKLHSVDFKNILTFIHVSGKKKN